MNDYNQARIHFIKRLKERYNLTITFDEYDRMVKQSEHSSLLYPMTKYAQIHLMVIQGVKVIVLRYKKTLNRAEGFLRTCIVISTENYPMPFNYLRNGITHEDFDAKVNEAMVVVNKMVTWLKENNGDTRTLFTTNLFDVHKDLKNCAYRGYQTGIIYPNTYVIESIYPQIKMVKNESY